MSESVEDIGEVRIKKFMERKPKYKDEVIVTFAEKATRDAVKAQAYLLAEHREEAGMRLHIPDHLQKSFRALMNLSYELKKKHPALKRNIKFDEDNLDLFMDILTTPDGAWRRVDREQALKFNAKRRNNEPASTIGSEELEELLGTP